MVRCRWLSALLFWLIPASAWALDPTRHLSQYAHAAWRARDGFFNGTPNVVAQTSDGYIWVGTNAGLLRFDGVRFVPWHPGNGQRLPAPYVVSLLPAHDGGLWIATLGGLSRWHNGALTTYPSGVGGIAAILEDRQGKIWFSVHEPSADGASFCEIRESTPRCYGSAEGVPRFRGVQAIAEDARGDLWIGGDTLLLRWRGGVPTEFRPRGLMNNDGQVGVSGLVAMPDGTMWVGIGKAGPGLGLQRLHAGEWAAVTLPGFDSTTLAVTALRRDREGALWVGTFDQGIYRVHSNAVEHFDTTRGLSGNNVFAFTEDNEGNLWVATSQGIDRFSDTRVVSYSTAEGLCSSEVDTVLSSRQGGVWVGGEQALSYLKDGRVSCMRAGRELPGTQVTSLLEDHAGRLWIGLDTTLWVYDAGRFSKVRRADGSDTGMVTGITEDSAHRVWAAIGGAPRKLMRIEGFAVREEYLDTLPRRVAADPTGGVWVGLLNGDLAHYADGTLQTFAFAHGGASHLDQLEAAADGSVLAATSFGLIGWNQGRRLTLTTRNGLPCDGVTAMTFDADDNLWLFTECGLVRVAAADLQRWKRDPDARVSVEILDVFDGVQTGGSSFAGGATTADGRVWFANTSALLTLDPAHMRRNAVAPPVHIGEVIADRRSYPLHGVVHLPALTRDLEIDYVGLSFVAPAKMQFRYRLEGRDNSWQDPGTRRQAFYSDLRPGTYRFRVIASNNEGVWNEEGASLDFVVAAAWYQTDAFWAACLVTPLLIMWAVYQLRMRQLAGALTARFDERLAERTRLARDIHDTLLQTVQGSKMVADNALAMSADAAGMRHAMGQISTWLGQAVAEGRAAVNALRASTTKTNDLADALHRAIEDCRRQNAVAASLSVNGDPQELHPLVRDEIYRITYEAIRNACAHSGGSRLDVELSYDHDLTVRVADDGAGIDPAVASQGRHGHFGVQGMRERAARINAKLAILSRPGAGTEILLTVPGRVVYRKA
jgi:signal transduction histidine kinase/ligand-binding sensor domain-containing protein